MSTEKNIKAYMCIKKLYPTLMAVWTAYKFLYKDSIVSNKMEEQLGVERMDNQLVTGLDWSCLVYWIDKPSSLFN